MSHVLTEEELHTILHTPMNQLRVGQIVLLCDTLKELQARVRELEGANAVLRAAEPRLRHTGHSYLRGYLQALCDYAYMRDGVSYVGTTGTTLAEAEARIRQALAPPNEEEDA